MLQAQPRSPKPPALSPEPLQRARSRRPSTGGSLPSASAGTEGASGGLRLPCRRVNQDAHLRGGAGRSLHSPERGSCARLPTQILSSCPISWGPRFPWEEPKTGAPVPSCLEERSHSPSAGLSWGGGPRPHSGGILFLWSRLRKQERISENQGGLLQQRKEYEYFIKVVQVIKQHYKTKCVGRNLRSTLTWVKIVGKQAREGALWGECLGDPKPGASPSG